MSSDPNHDNEAVIGSGYVRSYPKLYAARLPYEPIIERSRINPYRSAQTTMLRYVNKDDKIAVINEQLTRLQKIMLEDAFIADSTTRRCVVLFAKFLMGKRTKTTIDVIREFMTPEMQEQVVSNTLNSPEAHKARTFIDQTNRKVKFREKLEGAIIQCKIGGRSVLKVEEEKGIPTDLKLLNWGKLGKVYTDRKTWELLAVEYADRKKEEPLRAEEIIYFPWQDYNVVADSLYMGASAVLPIVDITRVIRAVLSQDLPEASEALWADAGVHKFPPNTTKTAMNEFVNNFRGGRWHATSTDVEIQTFDLRPKVGEMIQMVRELQMMIIENFGIPEYLISSKNVPNRAVADLAMNVWRESDLNHARSWLQGIIEPQWYDTLMILDQGEDFDIEKFKLKAKLEFEDITFETLKDRAETVIMLLQAGLMTLEKACKILDLEDVYEQILAQQKALERQRKEELEIMREEREAEQRASNNNSNNNNGNGDSRRFPPDEEEEEEEDEERAPTPRTRRTRQGSVMKLYDEEKQALINSLVQASKQGQQEQQKPVIPQENPKDKELQDLQIKLKEKEIAEANERIAKLQQENKNLKDQQETTKRIKEKLDSLKQPTNPQ